ncbi:50S ribosomal protein L18 [Methanobacterium congolense]|uniref:Large ribosomal subunit protein uL18 n=1 Tax=Methanobacterium congolense TaxID=118062 RepID=A0A1D3L327_9EURY|nr:50S ribosomal protein L18 [Methanobacterium congolense]SCG85919.1 50S ribosomal protein L18 [Methanobacterium congolense]
MAQGSRYKLAFRRRREGKTDYRARLKLISLEKSRLVVRLTNNHTIVQIIDVAQDGDETLISAHSKELQKMGWLGSGKNTSAAYLTGFLCAKKALEAGIDEAVLDIGLKSSIKGAKIYAALKGAVDAGLYVPHNDSILPADERIRGEHVAAYAESLSDEELKERFSQYIANGLSPKDLPDHFEAIKQKIEEGS